MRYKYRGIFDGLTDYAKYDAVEFDTKVWWCKRPVKGRSPADRFNSAVWVPIPDPLATALKSSGASSSYGTEVTYTEILPQETVVATAAEGTSALQVDLAGLVHTEVGKKYRVTFDGVVYTCEAFSYDAWGAVCVGNGKLIGSTVSNDEPFCINRYASYAANINVREAGTHTVSIEEIVEEVTPIPNEYLTGETPAPYMQLVTDGEGQAKWEQRLAWKEVKMTEIMPEETLETGSSGQATFSNDELRTALSTIGAQLNIAWNGTTYSCVVAGVEDASLYGAGNWYKYLELQGVDPSEFGFSEDTGEPFIIAASQDGVSAVPLPFVTNASFTLSVSGLAAVYTPVDANYLPIVSLDSPGAVKVYNFPNPTAPIATMVAAVQDFENGAARIFWRGEELVFAAIEEVTIDEEVKKVLYFRAGRSIRNFVKCVETVEGNFNITLQEPAAGNDETYLYSSSGKCFRLAVDDTGTLSAVEVSI